MLMNEIIDTEVIPSVANEANKRINLTSDLVKHKVLSLIKYFDNLNYDMKLIKYELVDYNKNLLSLTSNILNTVMEYFNITGVADNITCLKFMIEVILEEILTGNAINKDINTDYIASMLLVNVERYCIKSLDGVKRYYKDYSSNRDIRKYINPIIDMFIEQFRLALRLNKLIEITKQNRMVFLPIAVNVNETDLVYKNKIELVFLTVELNKRSMR